jgi:hypothetical protein
MENAGDWSAEMAAFAIRADRESFLRIYDYFMPRLCLYLRGMGTPESMAEELAENRARLSQPGSSVRISRL